MGVNTWCHSISVTIKFCAVLGAQGIRDTGFKRAQGNAHCAKFESHTNRVTFETNAIRMTSSVQALNTVPILQSLLLSRPPSLLSLKNPTKKLIYNHGCGPKMNLGYNIVVFLCIYFMKWESQTKVYV